MSLSFRPFLLSTPSLTKNFLKLLSWQSLSNEIWSNRSYSYLFRNTLMSCNLLTELAQRPEVSSVSMVSVIGLVCLSILLLLNLGKCSSNLCFLLSFVYEFYRFSVFFFVLYTFFFVHIFPTSTGEKLSISSEVYCREIRLQYNRVRPLPEAQH